ncbi:MAG: transposase [Flavobacteriaceae bacterium]|nr:transposase [Flavobacteriaceae bacterium]
MNDIEQTFRTLKSDLRLRPLSHQKDHRIEAHIHITIIAYYFVHYIRTKLRQHQLHDSWQSIQKELNRWQRTTVICRKIAKDKSK